MNVLGARESIGRRLTVTVTATTVAGLLLACAAIGWYDVVQLRRGMVENTTTLADVVALNSQIALDLRDPLTAEETLRALEVAGPILTAAIFDRSGEVFATYRSKQAANSQLPGHGPDGASFEDGYLDLRRPIQARGQRIGSIAIRSSTQELTRRIGMYAATAGVLVAAVGIFAYWSADRLRRQIATPLAEVAHGSRRIAEGDLSATISVSGSDEIGTLADSFNTMGESLRGVVAQVHDGVRDVSEATRLLRDSGESLTQASEKQQSAIAEAADSVLHVNSSIHEVNESVEQLADSARETSSSIVEMDASIRAVAEHMDHLETSIDTTSAAVSQVAVNTDQVVGSVEGLGEATNGALTRLDDLTASVSQVEANATASRELSDDTSREAGHGLESVRETIQAMRDISASFTQLDASVSRLASKSTSIDEILQVIHGVAEQTSLLSLNAAIIAAQAGEQGKAFSVVADEINSLATRTRQSTRDISELIAAVQEDTAAAVEAAEEGAAVVQKGVARSNDAGSVLERISEKSRVSAERVHEISDATTRQTSELARVNQSMSEVKEIVGQIIQTTRDQRSATTEIASAVENIRSVARGVKNSTAEQRKGSQLITRAVTDVSGMIHHIAEATKAQTQNRDQIQRALMVLNEASGEAGKWADSINDMVVVLSERAERLEAEVGRFRSG